MIFEKSFFFSIFLVHSSQWKIKNRKKKIPNSRLAFLAVTRRTGNDFLLKDGLGLRPLGMYFIMTVFEYYVWDFLLQFPQGLLLLGKR